MMRYLAGRLLRALVTIFLVVTFAFFVLRLSGDPALLIMSVDAPPESIEAFRKSWGLDQPIWVQYLAYVVHALIGDLGNSMRDGRPAIQLVLERVPVALGPDQLDEAGEACALGVDGGGGVRRSVRAELLLNEGFGHCRSGSRDRGRSQDSMQGARSRWGKKKPPLRAA